MVSTWPQAVVDALVNLGLDDPPSADSPVQLLSAVAIPEDNAVAVTYRSFLYPDITLGLVTELLEPRQIRDFGPSSAARIAESIIDDDCADPLGKYEYELREVNGVFWWAP